MLSRDILSNIHIVKNLIAEKDMQKVVELSRIRGRN